MESNSPIDILESEIRKLEDEIEPILRKIDGYKSAINLLRSQQESEEFTSEINFKPFNDYPVNADSYAKIGYIVNFYGRFIHAQDIKKMVLKHEKDAQAKHFLKSLSQKMYKCVQRGMLIDIQYNKSKHHTFYGKKEWITQDGNIYSLMRGYEPSAEYLKNVDQDSITIKRM